jgi:EmrB/QacA subfamily drug resistance transporter
VQENHQSANARSAETQRRPLAETWLLVPLILASGVVFLDSTVVNVALPAIDKSLNAGLSGLQWIVDGYVLTLSALLIPGGSLGDQYGRRRVMLIGLVGFGLVSMACGLAPDPTWLIGFRMLQGIAGALLVPGSLAILRASFPPGEARGQAIGRWSGWAGITTVIGPLLGGWLVDNLSWRWVFFINVPIILATLWLMVHYVPESSNESGRSRLDWVGAGLLLAGLGGAAYGLIQGTVAGWSDPLILASLAIGGACLLIFLLVESRQEDPMVPLNLFRSRNFTGANLTTLGVYFALYGTTFFLVIYIQNVMGYSALMAGVMLFPISLSMLVLSPFFGTLSGRYGARLFMSAGPVVMGLGLIWLSRLQPTANIWTDLIPAVISLGLGLSCTVAPLTDTVISAVTERRSGVAAALNNVVSRVAALLAVAGLGVVIALSFNSALDAHLQDVEMGSSAKALLANVAHDPTGSANLSSLPPRVQQAVEISYTASFREVMLVTAGMAWIGGLLAAGTIRRSQEPED